MSVITDFDIATDVKVELYVPNAVGDVFILGVSLLGSTDLLSGDGQFIIGYSLLGGTDVLTDGSSSYQFIWVPLECETSEMDISLGGQIQSNISFTPEPSDLAITVQSWTFDPNNNSAVRAGTRIRIRLDDGVVNHTLFSGFLETIAVTYRPEGPNLIKMTAFDGHKRLVNFRIDTWDTTGYGASISPTDQIDELATATGNVVSASSALLAGLIPTSSTTNVIANTFLNDALEVGLGIFWIDPETGELEVRDRPTVTAASPTTYIIGNNHPAPGVPDPWHLCMSDIKVNSNSDSSINNLKVSLSSNSATSVVVLDQDSIDLYGELAQDVAINTTDATELSRWANAVFAGVPTKQVEMVATPALDRQRNLTEAALFTPGTLIGVNYQTDNIDIVDYYTVVKARQSVDVNTWFTTLELWKEF
jgi:hypothetical protein